MAAIDTPWMTAMSTAANATDGLPLREPHTIAAFSPASTTSSSYLPRQRSTILVHQKSPLLLATPPQITRALAYSHPFLLPLNKLVGLLSWTTGDSWESFLLLAGFWLATLYGDGLIRWAGPLLIVASLVLLIYARRFSPLSSSGLAKDQAITTRKRSDSLRHHKSLDEIVESLRVFTARCNVLLDPFIRLTDFLSIQSTATSSTVRPALTSLFLRILMLTPIWWALTLPPLYIITTRRFVLTIGTFALSYHSRPARVSRTILWRSRTVRTVCSVITGLHFSKSSSNPKSTFPYTPYIFKDGKKVPRDAKSIAAALAAAKNGQKVGDAVAGKESIRFTFTIFENQRRWLGIGWTGSMLAYERAGWTDDQLNAVAPKDRFALPEVEGGFAQWRWVEDSLWSVEGPGEDEEPTPTLPPRAEVMTKPVGTGGTPVGKVKLESVPAAKAAPELGGWIYFDTKWRFPKRQDGWGRYTRRRKWCRDAELVEVDSAALEAAAASPANASTITIPYSPTSAKSRDSDFSSPTHRKTRSSNTNTTSTATPVTSFSDTEGSSSRPSLARANSMKQQQQRRPWFGRTRTNSKLSATDDEDILERERLRKDRDKDSGSGRSGSFVFSVEGREEDGYVPMSHRGRQGAVEADWGIGEDVGMALG